jgi:FAD/FMN-containing dehydrogenase
LSTQTALLALESFAAVQALFVALGQRLGSGLTAFEVMWPSFYETIAVHSGRHTPPLPAGHAHYVLIELSGNDPDMDAGHFEAVLAALLESGVAVDAVIAASKAQADALWKIRDDIEGLFQAISPSINFDVSLPIVAMEGYVAAVTAAIRGEWGEAASLVVFGHIGDGNLHIIIGPRPFDEASHRRTEEIVYGLLRPLKGSISAEHGIGLEKRDWLEVSRSPQEIALMRTIKAALDPKGILNPGKVLG